MFRASPFWSRLIQVLFVALLFTVCVDLVKCHDKDVEDESVVNKQEKIVYYTPQIPSAAFFAESFDDLNAYNSRWLVSTAKKDDADESVAKYNGEWSVEPATENPLRGDYGLVLKSKAKHHAISAKLFKPFAFKLKSLVVQYEVNFQNGQECGGAYIKLLSDSKDLNLKQFQDKTPYTIMFGPDKCGNDNKLHFIFRHRNPVNGTFTEKHSKKPTGKIEEIFRDKKSHLYTLVLNPDNTYEVLVDKVVVGEGNLLDDFTPPVNPPAEIDDPDDSKPSDWDDREKIADPDAKKPEDWDESAPRQVSDPSAVKPEEWLSEESDTIPDPSAIKPEDWDDEMDGEWEPPLINNPKCEKIGCGEWKAPLIDNPAYKGKWHAPTIDNPNYKGKWKPRKIRNPDFFEDKEPFKMAPIGAVGLELWSISDGIYFDNIIIADDQKVADQWTALTWELKKRKIDMETITLASLFSRTSKDYPYIVWLLYAAYCGIPVIVYVRYIQGRVAEEGTFASLLKYTNDRPWLWAVYLVAVALPIVLVVVFCCFGEDKQQKAAKAKKSDLSSPDDEPHVRESSRERSQEKNSGAKITELPEEDTLGAGDRGSPEPEEISEEEIEEYEPEVATAVEKEKTPEEEEEEEEEVEEEEEEEVEEVEEVVEEVKAPLTQEPASGRSPRKRRARKD